MAEFTRNLKYGMKGDDVLQVKEKLVELGYLAKCTHNKFGVDTRAAVKKFQKDNGLEPDGIVGILTWSALFEDDPPGPTPVGDLTIDDIPLNISRAKAKLIVADLNKVSKIRQDVVLTLLPLLADPDNHEEYPRAFYIRGGNLYNTDLTLNVMTKKKLDSYFKKSSYAPYFDGGRKEMMIAASEESGYSNPGADCSGMVVGLLRKNKLVTSGFDACANSLYAKYSTKTTSPKPGDFAHRDGHIGMVIGGGYVGESLGGAYGFACTLISNRKAYNFVDKKIHKFSAWSAFGMPKCYKGK